MNVLRTILPKLMAQLGTNLGIIALVALLAYVVFNEFIRPSKTNAALTDSIETARQARADVRALRLDVQQAKRHVERAVVLNSGLLEQGRAVLDSIQATSDSWQQRRAGFIRQEQLQRASYEAQKNHIRNAQNLVK